MTKKDLENEEDDEDNLYKRKHASIGKLPEIHIEEPHDNAVTRIDMKHKFATIKFSKPDSPKREEETL